MATSFRYRKLDPAEAAALGRNVAFEIDYAGLAGAGATTSTVLTLLSSLASKTEVSQVCFHTPAGFVGASVTNLKLDVGVTAATQDFVNQAELISGSVTDAGQATFTTPSTTTVDETYATPESTVLTNLRTLANQIIGARPKVLVATSNLLATFTATGANLSALTAGNVVILANVVDLSTYRAP